MKACANRVAQLVVWLIILVLAWLVTSSLVFLWLSGLLGDPRIVWWQRPIAWWLYMRTFGRDWLEALYLVVSALPLPAVLVGVLINRRRRSAARPLYGETHAATPQEMARGGLVVRKRP